MKEVLEIILKFLKDNSTHNKELQSKFALGSVGHKEESFDKLVALLYDTLNTQSQADIEHVCSFIKKVYQNKNQLNSFNDFFQFVEKIRVKDPKTEQNIKEDVYGQLFKNIKGIDGWGPKTSALLIKNIYNYHHCFNLNGLRIWDDVPKLNDDKLFLPVDAVIKYIFNRLSPKFTRTNKPKDWSFDEINEELQFYFSNEDIILFDDLWFWGFYSGLNI